MALSRARRAWIGTLAALAGAAGLATAATTPAEVRMAPPGHAIDSAWTVVFPHRLHEEFSCYACHPGVAAPARPLGGHAAFARGEACGQCHDGRRAFAAAGNATPTCTRCHTRLEAAP